MTTLIPDSIEEREREKCNMYVCVCESVNECKYIVVCRVVSTYLSVLCICKTSVFHGRLRVRDFFY